MVIVLGGTNTPSYTPPKTQPEVPRETFQNGPQGFPPFLLKICWPDAQVQPRRRPDARWHQTLVGCFKPLRAQITPDTGGGLPRKISFSLQHGYSAIELPCGRCIGCRLAYSRSWAARAVHEASLHELSIFVTLTYSEEHLPPGGTLVRQDVQDFMRRLRRTSHPAPVRFYGCGEYGDGLRPHYHLLLFGIDFTDKVLWRKGTVGSLYTSESLSALWGKGFVTIGPVNYETAAYVARYVVKKLSGEPEARARARIDPETGELHQVLPEFSCMSLKPGIGADWFARYHTDLYPDDFVVAGGKKRGKPPRYYDKLLERDFPAALTAVKAKRLEYAMQPRQEAEQTRARRHAREFVATAKTQLRKRTPK